MAFLLRTTEFLEITPLLLKYPPQPLVVEDHSLDTIAVLPLHGNLGLQYPASLDFLCHGQQHPVVILQTHLVFAFQFLEVCTLSLQTALHGFDFSEEMLDVDPFLIILRSGDLERTFQVNP
jgi:hypothetical protein